MIELFLVSNESIPGGMTWRRDCAMKGENELDCKDRIFEGREVYECLCSESLCNKNTDEETSTKKSTTVHGITVFFALSIKKEFYLKAITYYTIIN